MRVISRSVTSLKNHSVEGPKKQIVCPMDSNFKSLKEKIFQQINPYVSRKCKLQRVHTSSQYASLTKDPPVDSNKTSINNQSKSSIFPIIGHEEYQEQKFRKSLSRNFGNISHNHSLSHSKSQNVNNHYRNQLSRISMTENK